MDSNLPSNSRPSLATRPSSLGVACVLLAACAVSSACATAINGTTQRVAVASDPPGAQVYLHDAPVGVTPAFVDVPRRDPDLQLRLDKEGYEPTAVPLERSRSGWSWGNVLFAGVPINDYGVGQWVGAMAVYGVLGSLSDAMRGGAYKRPDLVRATLDPIPPVNETTAEGAPGSQPAAWVVGAPGVSGRHPRNRLVPMRLSEGSLRLTDRRFGWVEEQLSLLRPSP